MEEKLPDSEFTVAGITIQHFASTKNKDGYVWSGYYKWANTWFYDNRKYNIEFLYKKPVNYESGMTDRIKRIELSSFEAICFYVKGISLGDIRMQWIGVAE